MARPKKRSFEKRNQRFNLRYTTAEIEHLRLQAEKVGLHPHEYARRRSLGASASVSRSRRADPALISELNRIGVNLNQLARVTHMGKEFSDDWGDLSLELQRILNLVIALDGA